MGVVDLGNSVTRRTLLGAGAAALVLGHPISALAARRTKEERVLSLVHLHTGESVKCPYWINGRYIGESVAEINHLLRDHRTDTEVRMDPALLDLLWLIRSRTGNRTIEVFSAYRSPSTNAMLRSRSRGVARRSYHMQGKATDISIPGVSDRQLVKLVRSLNQGGVGYYPRSSFVHVDTGPVRYWRG